MNKKLKSEKLKWFNDTAKLKDLIPYEDNPRILTDKQRADLRKSLEKFDLAEVPAIDTDDTIIAGHMRIDILKELNGTDYEIDIRRPNRPLTKKEREEYLIRSNKNTGEWDFGKIQNFDMGELEEWGFGKEELVLKMDTPALDPESEPTEESNKYKIEVKFTTEMDMMDLYDDLISKGYLAKIVK